MKRLAMVFDVESCGLQGEGFAYGFVVIDLKTGELQEARRVGCNPAQARGTTAGFAWVIENVPSSTRESVPEGLRAPLTPRAVRDDFWASWLRLRETCDLWADTPWPVEARFLVACVDDGRDGDRDWLGPYPLLDAATALEVYVYPGYKPVLSPWKDGNKIATSDAVRPGNTLESFGGGILRLLRQHDPLHDAYVSARQLYAAVGRLHQSEEST